MTDDADEVRQRAYNGYYDPVPTGGVNSLSWMREQDKKIDQFKVDALAEIGISGHPKAGEVLRLAAIYGGGHFGRTYDCIRQLANLLK